jgi:hypothetical protein
LRFLVWAWLALWSLPSVYSQSVVINEVMYHPLQPALGAEPLGEEFIELYNVSPTNVNLAGWHFNKGVNFTLPSIDLASGGYLVVSANTNVFRTRYPGVNNVVGNWAGTLANNGETIELKNATGDVMDTVTYASEGDWAVRRRGLPDVGHRGWKWYAEADGLGKSMERRNPALMIDSGQNWAPSVQAGGTPGRVNAAYTNNVAPLILNCTHVPVVPHSTDPITITARIIDEFVFSVSVTLFWRVDGAAQFTTAQMRDDGGSGDGAVNDGVFGAILPPQANGAVIEFFVLAMDSGSRANTWPGVAVAASDGGGPSGQVANALLQVDDNPQNAFGGISPLHPVYKMIMTEAERAELASIPPTASASNAEMNGTFITLDGTSTELRYNCGFRNRGHGSRSASPPNYRVDIPNDRRWKGQSALNLNSQNTTVQVLGSVLAKKAGLAGGDSRPAQVRVNGFNLSVQSASMLGAYASNEELNADWATEHFPLDSAGNIYRAIRDIAPPEWAYRGPDPSAYVNTYFKTDNSSAYDWSDLIQLHRIVGTNDLFTTPNVRQVANVDQWMLFFGVMSVFGNSETSPNTGYNDDYFMYRGVNDARFILLYYDNDSILGIDALGTGTSIFSSEANNGIGQMTTRFLEWPDFKPTYYATLQHLLDTTFSQTEFDATVDEVFNSYPATDNRTATITTIKGWMNARRTSVLSQINGFVPPATNNPVAAISGEPRSPTPSASASLTIGGTGVSHYRFRLNGSAFGGEFPVSAPLALSGLPNGSTNTVYVIGRNSAGIYQDPTNPTVSKTWVVNTSLSRVRLNEVLALNTSISHEGTTPDLIELFNEGATAADLSGLRLTDDPAQPNKFIFPPGTGLLAGGYLVLYANNPDGTSGFHLGFSLSSDGDAVYLYDSVAHGGGLLDSVQFGLQLADLSIGRLTTGDWLLGPPTFGGANAVQPLGVPSGLKINEWLTAGSGPFPDDYIELFNTGLPVALGGMSLTDEPIGAPGLHRIAPLSFVGEGGYALFVADGDTEAGPNHLNFQLSSTLGEIALFDAEGAKVDIVSYAAQRTGLAEGRCPDGASTFNFMVLPTPGAGNLCPPSTEVRKVPLVGYSDVWRYDQVNNYDGIAWMAPGFDDSFWPSGPAVLGVLRGGGFIPEPVRTPLTLGRVTYYFRTQFVVPPDANIASLQLSHIIDDGAVLYLNGQEIYRYHFNPGQVVTNGLVAQPVNGDPTKQGPITLGLDNLQTGLNFLAIEVHQSVASSADVLMGLSLDGVVATNSSVAAGVVINEVAANNPPGGANGGINSDWVELYNPSLSSVVLAGMSLSTSANTNARRWYFPPGAILPPRGYVTVQFDGDVPASDTNTGFGLSATGDSVYLLNPAGVNPSIQDFVNFGLQIEEFTIGRLPDGTANWTLTVPTYGLGNVVAAVGDPHQLKLNEWMASPLSGDDWFEIYNPGSQPVPLGGLYLTDDYVVNPLKSPIPALSYLSILTNAYQQFHADNKPGAGADHVNFKLNASAQRLGIVDSVGHVIDGYSYGQQQAGVSEGRLPDGATSVFRFPVSASPGEANFLPFSGIAINEALTHTDLPLEDAIEIQNVGELDVSLQGWYLSDSKNNLRKFLITNSVPLAPGGFRVFYEYQFNDPNFPSASFSLSSSKGDQIYLSEAVGGRLTGYRATAKFGPAANGVSFGRYVTSQGAADFLAMSGLSLGTPVTAQSPTNQNPLFRTGLGATNPYPKVGPVVISEIMYHPPDIVVPGVSTNDNVVEEFVELRNITGNAVPLYDPAYPTNGWRLRDGVDFHFDASHTLPAGGSVLVVSFDPATDAPALLRFQTRYGSNLFLVGPYSGKLDNGGESVELARPDTPELAGADAGLVPYILVDKVVYGDSAPWPTTADGLGHSLQRVSLTGYGNDVTNWLAAAPSPNPSGQVDSDHDGMPDDWELQYGFDPLNPADASQDFDGDGMTNLQEYRAGTHPKQAGSVLRLLVARGGNSAVLTFNGVAGKTYSILYTDQLTAGAIWGSLTNVPALDANQAVNLLDTSLSDTPQRFYRVICPAGLP